MMKGLEGIFIWVLEKSLPAAVIVLSILILRVLLQEYPKKYAYALWAPLAVRLLWLLPMTNRLSFFHLGIFKSDVWRSADTIPQLVQTAGGISGAGRTNLPSEPLLGEAVRSQSISADIWQRLLTAGTLLWLLGAAAFAAYFVVSYYKMRRKVCCGVRLRENIYECDDIPSPFVMGVFHPRIYLPFHMEEAQQNYVICHEQYHIRRRDHLVKLLAYFLLAVYWFHPLVWLSYFLMCRDMEMSCDEGVLEQMGMDAKQGYSSALLKFATVERMPGNLLGFGEHNARSRILNILHFRPAGKAAAEFLSLLCVFAVMIFGCEAAPGSKPLIMVEESLGQVSQEIQELYEARTPYLGNASAVSRILELLEGKYLPRAERAIQLESGEEPYVLRLLYEAAPADEEELEFLMTQGGTLLLALVENLGEVQLAYPKIENGEEVMVTGYWNPDAVAAMLPEVPDIKECGKSQEALAELVQLLDAREAAVSGADAGNT